MGKILTVGKGKQGPALTVKPNLKQARRKHKTFRAEQKLSPRQAIAIYNCIHWYCSKVSEKGQGSNSKPESIRFGLKFQVARQERK